MLDFLKKFFPLKKWQVFFILLILLILQIFAYFDKNIGLIEDYLASDDRLIGIVGEITNVSLRSEHIKYDAEKKQSLKEYRFNIYGAKKKVIVTVSIDNGNNEEPNIHNVNILDIYPMK